MWRRLPIRTDRRAASGGAALFAVAAAALLLAVDLGGDPGDASDPRAGLDALRGDLDGEAAALWAAIAAAWADAPPGESPEVRARWAADSLAETLGARYPATRASGARVELEAAVSVEAGEAVLSDLSVAVHGQAVATRGAARVLVPVEVALEDPTHPMAEAVVRSVVLDGIGRTVDPVGSTLRETLAREVATRRGPLTDVAAGALEAALDAAARAAEESLGAAPPATRGGPAAGTSGGAAAAPARGDILQSLNATQLAAYVAALCRLAPCPAPVRALLEVAASDPALFRRAADLVAGGGTAGPLEDLGPAVGAWVEAARPFLQTALTRLRDALEAARGQWLSRVAGSAAPPEGTAVRHVRYHASHIEAVTSGWSGPLLSGADVLLPLELQLRFRFLLQSVVALPLPDGTPLTMTDTRPVEVRVSLVGSQPPAGAVDREERNAGPAVLPLVAALGTVLDITRILRTWPAELASRFARLRQAVVDRVEDQMATTISRLVFRVLDAAIDGDVNRTVRASFSLFDKLLGNDLRDALTVNFTAFGHDFTLVPDPLKQQLTLSSREGPHTFGVRLRRLVSKKNPLEGRYGPVDSLAVELFWRYREGRLSTDLVVDPFMRTPDGLLRFSLVAQGGRGMAFDLVAPQVTRVAEVAEASLSDVLPGGVPLLVTPTGGLLSLDMAVRAEFLELRRTTVLKWIAQAAEAAWLDVVDRLSVREAAERIRQPDALRQLAGRFLVHLADVAAGQAGKLLSRVEATLSVVDREAAGTGTLGAQFGITVLEPSVVFRELASDVAAVALAGPHAQGPAKPIEWIPEPVHTRVGTTVRLRMSAGAGELLPAVGAFAWPESTLTMDLFNSLGAAAALLGNQDVRSFQRLSVGWDGFATSPRALLPHRDVDRNDRVDLFTATVRSLVGRRVLISEVVPAPAGKDSLFEYVELHNPGFAEVLLDGWSLEDASGQRFAIPVGTRVAPGGFLVVARSLGGFLSAYGALPDVSTLTLSLNDGGDTLELKNPEGWTSDRVWWGPGGLVPREGEAIARPAAPVAPTALPGSTVRWTGSVLDFSMAGPSPGSA